MGAGSDSVRQREHGAEAVLQWLAARVRQLESKQKELEKTLAKHESDENDDWKLQRTVDGDDKGSNFGVSLSLSSDATALIVGALAAVVNGRKTGSAFTYSLVPSFSRCLVHPLCRIFVVSPSRIFAL